MSFASIGVFDRDGVRGCCISKCGQAEAENQRSYDQNAEHFAH